MSLKPFATRILLGLAGTMLVGPTTADAAVSYADGDLLLSFRATGGTGGDVSYVVNLGGATQFTNLAPGAVLQLDTEIGNIKADLDALYGASWQTRIDFLWSVSGVQRFAGNGWPTNNTMFATNMQTGPITLGLQNSAAWERLSAGGAGTYALKIQAFGERFALGDGDGGTATGNVESTNSAFALTQPAGTINSYRSFMPGGINTQGLTAFSYFGGATSIEGSFANGTSGVALDLYTLQTGSSGSPGTFEGTFSIDNNATVTFTAAVPEPSSALALALGATVLGCIRRRHQSAH